MPSFLVDTSALARLRTRVEVREALGPLVRQSQVAICGTVELETLYSATSPENYRESVVALAGMPRALLDEACVRRALEVQGLLAERSQHRGVQLPDLLTAACAEGAGLTVLHYDADFERIAAVTGQPTRWVVPRGSVS
jgi:predicted nucleic acid-binding protein